MSDSKLDHSSSSSNPRLSDSDRAQALYRELRKLALGLVANESPGQALHAAALVHEAWLRLGEQQGWDRHSFLPAAASSMRRVLVDNARQRGNGGLRMSLEALEPATEAAPRLDLLALDEALSLLASIDARAFRIVELHFFGGLEFKALGELLKLSERTIEREWASARQWLFQHMGRMGEAPFLGGDNLLL